MGAAVGTGTADGTGLFVGAWTCTDGALGSVAAVTTAGLRVVAACVGRTDTVGAVARVGRCGATGRAGCAKKYFSNFKSTKHTSTEAFAVTECLELVVVSTLSFVYELFATEITHVEVPKYFQIKL